MKYLLFILTFLFVSCASFYSKSKPVFHWSNTKNEIGYGKFYYEDFNNVITYAGITEESCIGIRKLHRDKFEAIKWNRKIWVSHNGNGAECYCQFYEYTPAKIIAKFLTLTRYSPGNGRLSSYTKDYSNSLYRYRRNHKK